VATPSAVEVWDRAIRFFVKSQVTFHLRHSFDEKMPRPNAIVIGAGPSGIAMAYKLKHKLGFEDFTIYEKLDGVGGTWRTNTYPGW
jgi:ribulose 1,5-bisphosphate synthetase/thiazole synthase